LAVTNHRIVSRAASVLVVVTSLHGGMALAQQQGRPNDVQVGVPLGSEAEQQRLRREAAARRATDPAAPAPRTADGKVLIGSTASESGLWNTGPVVGNPLGLKDVPYQPWARALAADRRTHQLEPHTRCKPSGVARVFLTPYGVEFVEVPELQRLYIFDVGGPHTYRTIYMDGRTHPAHPEPEYYGHSIGWWEGDTLVVDTVGFNEGFWLDRGQLPHTDKLHTVERFTRTDFNTLRYELTIDDPGAYTELFGGQMNLRWERQTELFEYVCQQANYAHNLMVGQQKSVDRTTLTVP
jgi:hypothetical protein